MIRISSWARQWSTLGLAGLMWAAAAAPASAQELWGALTLPGGVPALRTVATLGDPSGRSDDTWLVDFSHRYYGRASKSDGIDTAVDYIRTIAAIKKAAGLWPDGCQLPTVATSEHTRSRVRDFVESLGLKYREDKKNARVELDDSRDARLRRAWLVAAGVDMQTGMAELNGGKAFKLSIADSSFPVPLPAYWRTRLNDELPAVALVKSRSSALLYSGLAGLDDETLGYLQGREKLIDQIADDSVAPFAAFGRSIHIRGNAVETPGGPAAEAVWQDLVGRRPSEPDRFIRDLLGRDDGRLAWFYDLVSHLDAPRQVFLLGLRLPEKARIRYAARVYDWFLAADPGWKISDAPFFQPRFSPASAAIFIDVTPDGTLGQPWWPALLERVADGGGWPKEPGRDFRNLDERRADADWAFKWIFESPERSERRFQLLRFAQRRFTGFPKTDAGRMGVALRTFADMPSLALSLERMGVRDLDVLGRLGNAADRLNHLGAADDARPVLVLWQSALALLEQSVIRLPMPSAQLNELLSGLASTVPDSVEAARGSIAAWLAEKLLPRLVPMDAPADQVEHLAIEALVHHRTGPDVTLTWEGLNYVIDPNGPLVRQAIEIRDARRTPHLGHLVLLNQVRRRLEAGPKTAADAKAIAGLMTTLVDAVKSLPTIGGKPPEIVERFMDAASAIGRIRQDKDAGKAARQLNVVRLTLDAMTEAALPPLVYAFSVSPSSAPTDVLADMWIRHTMLKVSDQDVRSWDQLAWQTPKSELNAAGGQVVRGSYLGLDVALAESRLRVLPSADASGQPVINEDDARAITEAVVLQGMVQTPGVEPLDRLAQGMRAGRARVTEILPARGNPDELRRALLGAGVDEVRASLMVLRAQDRPTDAVDALTVSEVFRLGTPTADALLPGTSSVPLDGCLCLLVPGGRRPEHVRGAVNGIVAALVTDLPLRLAEHLAELKLPAALIPLLVPVATADWLDHIRQSWPDDWFAMTAWPKRLPASRVEEYLLFLVSDGTLAPPRSAGGGPR